MDVPTREIVGQRIAQERKRARMTQRQMAEVACLEPGSLTRIEQGRQAIDTLQLSAIGQALGLPPTTFFEPTNEEPPEALLRTPAARDEEVRRQLNRVVDLVRDYQFLLELTLKESPD